ncbi:leukocyte elastase inhibitor-like [Condylostylus longicornis]|uniref:leukocyte elastase inhibitor-like n=1 Tax=Condylostylus longicornis TaxID=2530218 RepID=UPI00244DAD00|nr:leukocyte elastase inhibitor-like [Condylostylus longicornis]
MNVRKRSPKFSQPESKSGICSLVIKTGAALLPVAQLEASSIFGTLDQNFQETLEVLANAKTCDKTYNPKKALSSANAAFSLELLRELSKNESENSNVFFSPLSVQTAMGMVLLGSRGSTNENMTKALCFKEFADDEQLHGSMKQLLTSLKQLKTVHLANRLYVDEGFRLFDDYKKKCLDNYFAEAVSTDFRKPAECVDKINTWVKSVTADKIDKLITKEDLLGPLVLLNAIHFKGKWMEQFDPKRTKDAEFHIGKRKSVKVPLMYGKMDVDYMEDQGFRAIRLPYKDDNLSMTILLPDNSVQQLSDGLTPERLKDVQRKMVNQKVEVYIPRFHIEHKVNLKKELSALGMKTAFCCEADFSGMSPSATFISNVIHQAKIEVNEEGTEAAAATAVQMTRCCRPPRKTIFRADRPFLFFIQNDESKEILFFGSLINPAKGK